MDELDILSHVEAAQRRPSRYIQRARWAQKESVVWEGSPKPKVAGADIRNRLYAGKKRMFKGHKWERTKAKLDAKRSMLLSDMKKRIVRYKGYYHRRRPDPLGPAKVAKAAKLPF